MENKKGETMPLNQRELSTELHRTQEKMNGIEKSLRQELAKTQGYLNMLRLVFKIVGSLIIILDIVKDRVSENLLLHYNEGMGWQQWVILLFGFFLLFIGMYKKSK